MDHLKQLLPMLRSPVTQTRLEEAADTLIARLNEAIGNGQVRDASGRLLESPVESGMVEGGQPGRLFPIRGGVLILVADQAIPVPWSEQESSNG